MECLSGDSEFIESLEYLSPPVKRRISREAFGSRYYKKENNLQLLREIQQKIPNNNYYSPGEPINRTFITTDESSTSSVPQEKLQRRIVDQQRIISYTALKSNQEDQKSIKECDTAQKPLIRVTVIPKPDSLQAKKILRKRRYIPKPVQSTLSNQDNSVQTKKVYQVVAGRRKEKIYELKTAGSATVSSEKIEFINYGSKNEELKELVNFKHLMQSLNMDKKTKNKKSMTAENVEFNYEQNMRSDNKNYPYSTDKDGAEKDLSKNRLKIFGQFGINKDDQYVVRYGASFDNKPVVSDFGQLKRDYTTASCTVGSSSTEDNDSFDDLLESYKNAEVQADYNEEFDSVGIAQTETVPSKEAQGTQVNFTIEVKPKTNKEFQRNTNVDKKIQCNCMENILTVGDELDNNRGLKDHQSPLVIISVYPKQNPYEISSKPYRIYARENTKVHTAITNNISMSPQNSMFPIQNTKVNQSTEKQAIEPIKKNKRMATGRSRSPTKKLSGVRMQDNVQYNARVIDTAFDNKHKNSERPNPIWKTKGNAQDKTKHITKNSTSNTSQNVKKRQAKPQVLKNRPDSPQGLKIQQSPKHKDRTANVEPVTKNKEINNIMEQPVKDQDNSNLSDFNAKDEATKIAFFSKTEVISNKGIGFKSQQMKTANVSTINEYSNVLENFSRPNSLLKERSTNTDHAKAKKALVENYTKKLTKQQITPREIPIPPKPDNSRITISIDGTTEYYDVLFNQDRLTTDLTVRKKIKDLQDINPQDHKFSGSMENLFKLPGSSIANSESMDTSESQSDLLSSLKKHASRLTIRDSLEISHRREERQSNQTNNFCNNNKQNLQSNFTAKFAEPTREDSDFAPIKHFAGDDCDLGDPIARDKQIRELLGVDNIHSPSSKTHQDPSENVVQRPYHCYYQQECANSQVTELNLLKLVPCYKSRKCEPTMQSVSTQYYEIGTHLQPEIHHSKFKIHTTTNAVSCMSHITPAPRVTSWSSSQNVDRAQYCNLIKTVKGPFRRKEKNSSDPNQSEDKKNSSPSDTYDYSYGNEDCDEICSAEIEFECSNEECPKHRRVKSSTPIYQQLILNRNIQIFLQIEKFSKRKPITLTRKQYEKVKKTIQKTLSVKNNQDRKKCCNKSKAKEERSDVSFGEVRRKPLQDIKLRVDKEVQTTKVHCGNQCCKSSLTSDRPNQLQNYRWPDNEEFRKDVKKDRNIKKAQNQTSGSFERDMKSYGLYGQYIYGDDNEGELEKHRTNKALGRRTMVLYSKDHQDANYHPITQLEYKASTKKTLSSLEVRYASVAYMKKISSTDIGARSNSKVSLVNSFQTIFRGRRKCHTPNLGTSVCSFNTEDGLNSDTKLAKYVMKPQDSKPKKPFLKRLMSCLVMRSARTSELKLPIQHVPDIPSINSSSIDSYHISTSLGAIELSSSLYDTSASFYSNHTILPINSKMKRGFFSSVRGFLASRKS